MHSFDFDATDEVPLSEAYGHWTLHIGRSGSVVL